MRAASNPGGLGHDWVKTRFLDEGQAAGRIFIPSKLADNPYLDADDYLLSLAELDPVTRRQLLDGDWSARQAGGLFRGETLPIIDTLPAPASTRVRYWDLAATAAKPGTDPDWTVGALLAKCGSSYVVEDVRRMRGAPQQVETLILETARRDGPRVPIVIEQEPGSSGKIAYAHFARQLAGYTITADRVTGAKLDRARPLSSQADAGNVMLLRGEWSIAALLDELEAFPNGSHDDQVDAISGAFAQLTRTWGWEALYPEPEVQHAAA